MGSLGFFLFASSCEPTEYDPIPSIEWVDHEILYAENEEEDDTIKVVFSFIDGDGDLGLTDEDTIFVDDDTVTRVVFLDYFEFREGRYQRIMPVLGGGPDDTLVYYYNIPRLTESSNPKAIKGEVQVSIKPYAFPRDTTKRIRCRLRVIDRAGNWSNEVTSPDIIYKSPEK